MLPPSLRTALVALASAVACALPEVARAQDSVRIPGEDEGSFPQRKSQFSAQ